MKLACDSLQIDLSKDVSVNNIVTVKQVHTPVVHTAAAMYVS